MNRGQIGYSVKLLVKGLGSELVCSGSYPECDKVYKRIKTKLKNTKGKWFEISEPLPLLLSMEQIIGIAIDHEVVGQQVPFQNQFDNMFLTNTHNIQNQVLPKVESELLDEGMK